MGCLMGSIVRAISFQGWSANGRELCVLTHFPKQLNRSTVFWIGWNWGKRTEKVPRKLRVMTSSWRHQTVILNRWGSRPISWMSKWTLWAPANQLPKFFWTWRLYVLPVGLHPGTGSGSVTVAYENVSLNLLSCHIKIWLTGWLSKGYLFSHCSAC